MQVEANGTGKYVEVGSGEMVDNMVRRYILNAQVMDFTKSTFVNLFNEQAEDILNMKADDLNNIKVSCCEFFITAVSACFMVCNKCIDLLSVVADLLGELSTSLVRERIGDTLQPHDVMIDVHAHGQHMRNVQTVPLVIMRSQCSIQPEFVL